MNSLHYHLKLVNFSRLQYLVISNNKLKSLPSEIGRMQGLKYLFLNDNDLSVLPSEIGLLQKLHFLDISANQISTLPPEINQLKNLRELRAFDNSINTLPNGIGKIRDFSILMLNGCQLRSLPSEIEGMDNLAILDLRGNPIDIPAEILQDPYKPQKIISYRLQTGRRQILKSKILFVGQGSVGKTSLVQQILHGTFDQNQTKTEGISINQWQVGDTNEGQYSKTERY